MPGNVDEKKWSKAKNIFKKQYGHDPKSSQDYAIVSGIYKKMGGKFSKEMLELAEQIRGMINMEKENLDEGVYDSYVVAADKYLKQYKNKSLTDLKKIIFDKEKPLRAAGIFDVIRKKIKKENYLEKLKKLNESFNEAVRYDLNKMAITSDLTYERKDVENILKMLDVAAIGYGITIANIKAIDSKNLKVYYKKKGENYTYTEPVKLMKTKIVLGTQDINIKNPKTGIIAWFKKVGIDPSKKKPEMKITKDMINMKNELLKVINSAKYFKNKTKDKELLEGYVYLKAKFTPGDDFYIETSYDIKNLKWGYDIQGIRPSKSHMDGNDFSSLNSDSDDAIKEIKEKLVLAEKMFEEMKLLYRQIENILKKYGKLK